MRILISNLSQQPIYEQIVQQIRTMILQGELQEGPLALYQKSGQRPAN